MQHDRTYMLSNCAQTQQGSAATASRAAEGTSMLMLSLIYKIDCIDALLRQASAALKQPIVQLGGRANSALPEAQRAPEGMQQTSVQPAVLKQTVSVEHNNCLRLRSRSLLMLPSQPLRNPQARNLHATLLSACGAVCFTRCACR